MATCKLAQEDQLQSFCAHCWKIQQWIKRWDTSTGVKRRSQLHYLNCLTGFTTKIWPAKHSWPWREPRWRLTEQMTYTVPFQVSIHHPPCPGASCFLPLTSQFCSCLASLLHPLLTCARACEWTTDLHFHNCLVLPPISRCWTYVPEGHPGELVDRKLPCWAAEILLREGWTRGGLDLRWVWWHPLLQNPILPPKLWRLTQVS